MITIKCRLYSRTFGKVVSKYVDVPIEVFEAAGDGEIFNAVLRHVIKHTGYRPHLGEALDVCPKL